jgi:KaiC/GvpD/RAD55 family RecA-like ATPase
VNAFWGEIAPLEHLVQIYDNDKIFLDTLEGFARTGLSDGESVIIIATPAHRNALDKRLSSHGFDVDKLIRTDHYIPLDVEETLAKFMVNHWPDEEKFNATIADILNRALRYNNAPRKVRAFGEMVAVLWERGMNGATVQLEGLWNQLHENKEFSLYCAYPKSGFTQSPHESLDSICKTHTKVISGKWRPTTEIYYRSVYA